jgi:hypothetical protein
MKTSFPSIVFFCATSALGYAAMPASDLYPFKGSDLNSVRAVAKAESSAVTPELAEAWKIYRAVQGSWAPGREKPDAATIRRLADLRQRLEAMPKPQWLVLPSGPSGVRVIKMADAVGDDVFKEQRSTPEYQAQKALALVYLAGHELDRPGDSNAAGKLLSILVSTHPWDWEVHSLFSRLWVDSKQAEAAIASAANGLFLNPNPTQSDLEFFAFVGAVAAKDEWAQIKLAIRDAALTPEVADAVIQKASVLYSDRAKSVNVPPKGN